MFKLYLLIAIIFCSTNAISQDFDREKMDELFSIIEKHEQGMGSFSLFKHGEGIYSRSFGVKDLKTRKKVDKLTTYRIGSISKTFTACIIMKLIEDKKLKLTTPLTRFFPRVKNSSRITISHLLNHSSGIYNFTNTDEYLNYLDKPLTRKELLLKVMEFGSAFEPGEESGYSNSNYVLLSMIAEEITGKTYDILIKEMIADPLELKRTYVGGEITTSNNEAKSFKKVKIWQPETETDMSIPLGAGAVVSNSIDINKFLSAFFRNEIVTEESRKLMMEIENGYGKGLFKIPFGDKSAFGHNGGIDGFQSMAYHFPKENLSITYLSNAIEYPINDLMIDALNIYFGIDKDLPKFLPVMKLKSEELDKYLGSYKGEGLPIELTITKEGKQLYGQATGQQSFILDAIDVNVFKFDPARLKIEFFPEEKRLILTQGGKEYKMNKN